MEPGKKEARNLGGRPTRERPAHRISLMFEDDLEPYVDYMAKQNHISKNQWINDRVRACMNDFLANGGKLPAKALTVSEALSKAHSSIYIHYVDTSTCARCGAVTEQIDEEYSFYGMQEDFDEKYGPGGDYAGVLELTDSIEELNNQEYVFKRPDADLQSMCARCKAYCDALSLHK